MNDKLLPDVSDQSDAWTDRYSPEEILDALGPTDDETRSIQRQEQPVLRDTTGRPSKAARAIAYADEIINESFATPDGEAYIDVVVDDVPQTLRVRSRETRALLDKVMYDREQTPLGSGARQDAIDLLEARARHEGICRAVSVRIAERGGEVWLDVGGPDWRAVRVNRTGWTLVESHDVPVRFRRSRGMRAVPVPVHGGTLDELRSFIHADDGVFVLIIAFLLSALRARGPYPVLAISGEQGSAKSTAARLVRELIDPHDVPLRSPPRDERDLMVSASNTHVLALDNLSCVQGWLSDALCRIATGGGFATRELYTDSDECILSATRPTIITSIEAVVTRADLADRAYGVELSHIDDRDRRTERDIYDAFARSAPRILGALLDVVAYGLAHEEDVRLDRLPRLADAARWVVACEPACPWPTGSYLHAYSGVREDSVAAGLTGDAAASAVVGHFERSDGEWSGTYSDLLAELNKARGDVRPPRDWPQTPRALSGRLTRAAPLLREGAGIELIRSKDTDRNRTRRLTLRRIVAVSDRPMRPDGPIENSTASCRASVPLRTIQRTIATTGPSTDHPSSADESDDADGADDEPPQFFGVEDQSADRAVEEIL